ncbi:Murein hydrolase activator NlpD [Candidatus Erwinia haradaeae]|uniref:Murein hydrolase activator NlpD n=1 Tax=Candidatus Erwinia haradaeae TaxID=1922217 RepID=A0A451DJ36_9GAMM|nr:murein hydrolase activator NlpD [Candidatus Erwinia haradaeae]VFP86702.1 Murein hydrolase activator NlpD [Candidatus Erwinia haradaeae]
MKLHCIATLALGVFSLISCSSSHYTEAPVSIVNAHISKKNISNSYHIRHISNVRMSNMIGIDPVHRSYKGINLPTQNRRKDLLAQNNRIFDRHSYSNLYKGSYKHKIYVVKKGDTLFYISWISGNKMDDLAKRNHIIKPYVLLVGQKLQVSHAIYSLPAVRNVVDMKKTIHKNHFDCFVVDHTKNTTKSIYTITRTHPKVVYLIKNNYQLKPNHEAAEIKKLITKHKINRMFNKSQPLHIWCWPSNGKIINYFSDSERGNKGIDIQSNYGATVVAAANGRVVYTGNALRGYGNLIIIKHHNNYLSAYAHNASILVHENQEVKAGQKISTMGKSGAISVRLHFEIRYKGESVNPLLYLPTS